MHKINCIFFLITILFIIVSCQNDNTGYAIGSEIVPINSDVIVSDTFSIGAYTVKYDSIATSGFTNCMVGLYNPTNQYMDGYLGTDTVSAYFTVNAPTTLPLLNSLSRNLNGIATTSAIYDSCVLLLRNSHYYYGDTTLPFTVNVHHLSRQLIPVPNVNGLRYNNSKLTPDDQNSPIIGSKVYYPRPSNKLSEYVRLNDTFGLDLFNKVDSANAIFTIPTQFSTYINSFLLTPGKNSSSVIGFAETDSALTIRIYYNGNANVNTNLPPAEGYTLRFFDFKVSTTSHGQYNRVIPNSPYPLNTIKYQFNKVSAKLTNNLTFLQGSTGYMTRLEFPSLPTILATAQNIKLLSATLYLVVQRQSFQYFTMPPDISVYQTDDENDLVGLINSTGSTSSAKLYVNKLNDITPAYYAIDITAFVNNVLTTPGGLTNTTVPAILITPQFTGVSSSTGSSGNGSSDINRLVIDNKKFLSNQSSINATGITINYWRY